MKHTDNSHAFSVWALDERFGIEFYAMTASFRYFQEAVDYSMGTTVHTVVRSTMCQRVATWEHGQAPSDEDYCPWCHMAPAGNCCDAYRGLVVGGSR